MSTTTEQPTTTATAVTPAEEESYKVFIGNLSFTSTDESLKAYFSDAGEVLETIIIRKGSRPKGYGFVAFRILKEAEKAVKDFDKKELDGREISVQLANQRDPPKPVEKKKKRKSSNKKSRKTTATSEDNEQEKHESEEITDAAVKEEPTPKTSVFVANLPLSIKMNDLAELFKDYEVESALVAIQTSGRSKGYGFVELKTVEEMHRVLKEFVDVEVQGRPIHVSAATSEKNIERRIKPKKVVAAKASTNEETTAEKKKSTRNRKPTKKATLTAKENEGVEAAKEAQEAVRELKEDDGIEAAKEAQEAVRELKEEDGDSAAKAANAVIADDAVVHAEKN